MRMSHQGVKSILDAILGWRNYFSPPVSNGDITVNFIHPLDGKTITVTLNDSMAAHEVITELIANKFVQPNPDGYNLAIRGEVSVLIRSNQSFREAGVINDDAIYVIPSTSAGGFIVSTYDIVRFLEWINGKYPNLNALASIPSEKLNALACEFSEEYYPSQDYAKDLLMKELKKRAYSNSSIAKFQEIIDSLLQRKKTSASTIDSLQRYKSIRFHGIFLFVALEKTLICFINEYWKELNALTGDCLDIYYSEEEVKDKCGYEILSEFQNINTEDIMLPCFILWEETLRDTIVFQLRDLSKEQIFDTLQFIVQGIKNNLSLNDIKGYVWQKMQNFLPTMNAITSLTEQTVARLPSLLQQKIIEFFISLPTIHDSDAQRSLLLHAGVDAQLQAQIPFGKPPVQFAPLLLSKLLEYGNLADGEYAIVTVLETTKAYIGLDKQEYCDILIDELRQYL